MRKIGKRLAVILLAMAMVVTCILVAGTRRAYAADGNLQATGSCGTVTDGTFSSNATYTYDQDQGALTINGTGEIGSRAFADYADKANVKAIVIGAGITDISPNAFEGLTGVTTVSLPEGLKTIGEQAFYNCFKLKTIVFPSTLEEIETLAFYNDGISEIDIPASMKKLNWDAFGAEPSMGTIKKVIMRSVNIEFAERNTAVNTRLLHELKTAGPIGGNYDYQFAWTEKIPDHAFAYLHDRDANALESVTLPDTITEIGYSAFSGAENLTSIILPEGLKTIGWYAFNGTGLTDVSLPASVEKVGREAFNDCANLAKITILNPNCEIYDDFSDGKAFALNAVIAGYNDSTAQHFAEQHNRTFESLGNAPCPKGGEHDWVLINHKATFTDYGFQSMECSKCGASNGIAIGALAVKTVKLAKNSYVYTGKAIKPKVTLENADGTLSTDYYDLTYSKNTNVGKASVKITLKGDYFEGSKTLTFSITPAANPLKISAKTATVKYSKLKKKAQSLAVTKVINFTKTLSDKKTYTLSSAKKGSKSFKKYFTINKTTGKLTVKKGLKKGTYKVAVAVKASGNANYKASAAKTVTFKVVVK